MPTLKPGLLIDFYARSRTTETAFAARCGLSRQTLQNAQNGLSVQQRVVRAMAGGMGLEPAEAVWLCEGDRRTVAEVVELALLRLGSGLWGGDLDFVRTDRFDALFGRWRGVQVQTLRGQTGEERLVETVLDGELRRAGRTVLGEFTQTTDVPGFFVGAAVFRVEGYWLGDNHCVAIYRFADTSMPNYGTVHLTLSLCGTRLDGTFVGWGHPISAWVTGAVHLRREDPEKAP